ncbi:MAG: hypothetical protein WCT07_01005 [Candidatus Paceibacterota bacterium]
MFNNLFFNIDFWGAFCGLLGTIIIFFFGLPPKVDVDGNNYLLLQKTDEKEKVRARKYKKLSYFGLLLIALSFLLQILKLL